MDVVNVTSLHTDLAHIATISRKKRKKTRGLNILNGILIATEIVIFTVMFIRIFYWHIEDSLSNKYIMLLGLILVIYVLQMLNRELFRFVSPYSWLNEMVQILKASGLTFMITAGMLFLMKVSYDYSRLVVGLFFVSILITSLIIRLGKRFTLYRLARKSMLTKNILIIGAGKVGQNVYEHLSSLKNKGYKIIGFLDDYKEGSPIIGKLSDIESCVGQYEVDEIVITIPSERHYVYSLIRNIQKYKIKVKIIPELYDIVSSRVGYEQLDPYPFVEVSNHRMKGWHGFSKRIVDILLSGVAMVCLFPIYVMIWTLVKLSSPGPAIFRQARYGKDGRKFYIYKFRSMVIDAEQKLRDNAELYEKYVNNNYKLEPHEDPRITRFGRFLRSSSLDELPQLLNVLKGEMSLVGPRPVVQEELREYDHLIFDFLSVKPGMTGYWQVSGRSEAGYPERTDIELYYVYNQSLSLDFKIILKTFTAVLKRKGAY